MLLNVIIMITAKNFPKGVANAPHLHIVSQPAWYFGNNNKIKPSDGHLLIAAGRYGYRGSQGIKQYSTEAYEDPRVTRTDQTPAHLTN